MLNAGRQDIYSKLVWHAQGCSLLYIKNISLVSELICLVIRLVLQFNVAYYASIAGKLHFNLCLALCLVLF